LFWAGIGGIAGYALMFGVNGIAPWFILGVNGVEFVTLIPNGGAVIYAAGAGVGLNGLAAATDYGVKLKEVALTFNLSPL